MGQGSEVGSRRSEVRGQPVVPDLLCSGRGNGTEAATRGSPRSPRARESGRRGSGGVGKTRGCKSEISPSPRNPPAINPVAAEGTRPTRRHREAPIILPYPRYDPHGRWRVNSRESRIQLVGPRPTPRPHERTPLARAPRTSPVPCGYALTSGATVRDALFSSRDSGYLPSPIAGNGWHSRFGADGSVLRIRSDVPKS